MTVGTVDDDEPDDALVRRASGGDVRAYTALVRRHERVVVRVAVTVGQGGVDAEAVAQEAFLRAYRALPRFTLGQEFRPWLLAITANEARNQRRSARRHAGAVGRLAAAAPPAPVASAESEALGAAQRTLLLEAVARLPERDRLVITCRYLLELSEREAAAVLGVPPGTVKSRLARALGRLRRTLAASPARELGGSRHGD